MSHALQETAEQTEQLRTTLEQYVVRISDGLRDLALNGDWEAIKSALRVLDAHSRANELRAQGQPARAHLWLVGVGRKRQKRQRAQTPNTPQPAA